MTKKVSGAEDGVTAKGRAMRDRIIENAGELMFASGVQQTTLDNVKDAAGASKSQVYHYFSDKDALVQGVIAFQGARIIETQQPELGAIDSIQSLKRWRNRIVQACDTLGVVGGCPIGSLANELSPHSESHRRALAVHFDHWAALIKAGLQRMQENGSLGPALNPKALSIALLAAVQGGLLFAKLNHSSKAMSEALDEIIQLIETSSKRAKVR